MKSDSTDITVILDRSGSMGPLQHDTIGGFNHFLSDQQALPGGAMLTVVQFDHEYSVPITPTPIRDVVPLTPETYQPRGSTALLDAVGRTIQEVGDRLKATAEADRPGKVVMVIITDGQENASAAFTKVQVRGLITQQQTAYKWEFLFLGANVDAFDEARGLGIPTTHAANYGANAGGLRSAYTSTSAAVSRTRSGFGAALTADEQDALNNTVKR